MSSIASQERTKSPKDEFDLSSTSVKGVFKGAYPVCPDIQSNPELQDTAARSVLALTYTADKLPGSRNYQESFQRTVDFTNVDSQGKVIDNLPSPESAKDLYSGNQLSESVVTAIDSIGYSFRTPEGEFDHNAFNAWALIEITKTAGTGLKLNEAQVTRAKKIIFVHDLVSKSFADEFSTSQSLPALLKTHLSQMSTFLMGRYTQITSHTKGAEIFKNQSDKITDIHNNVFPMLKIPNGEGISPRRNQLTTDNVVRDTRKVLTNSKTYSGEQSFTENYLKNQIRYTVNNQNLN